MKLMAVQHEAKQFCILRTKHTRPVCPVTHFQPEAYAVNSSLSYTKQGCAEGVKREVAFSQYALITRSLGSRCGLMPRKPLMLKPGTTGQSNKAQGKSDRIQSSHYECIRVTCPES